MRSITIALYLLLAFANDSDGDCIVAVRSPRQPVYVTNETSHYELLIPTVRGLYLQQGERILLLCSGHLNRLNQSSANVTTAICASGDKFLVSNQIHKFPDLECRRAVRASVIHTEEICLNGFISHIGYHVGGQFLKLIEVCYDTDQANTIYTRHTLLMPGLKVFHSLYTKPTFTTKGLTPDNKSVSLVYYSDAQKARLSSILQSSISASNYITNKIHLVRGQLSPEEDFALVTWKYATYFFLNACPLWQQIDTGNWKLIESMVRKLKSTLDENMQIITGTYEVLELMDRTGNLKSIYLSQRGKKFPVPRYIWKIVYTEKSKKAIVLVVYNNPYDLLVKPLCSCICRTHGWHTEYWSDIKRGLIQCCNFSQFKQIVRSVPNLVVTGILDGPE